MFYLCRFSNGFQIVVSPDSKYEGVELVKITTKLEPADYRAPVYCGCSERHWDYAEGTVQVHLSGGYPTVDYSGVKDPSFPCENGSSDAEDPTLANVSMGQGGDSKE